MNDFDFEKLDVFKMAREFVISTKSLVRRVPPDWSFLALQLRRSASSIPLNIAEGAGEWMPAEKSKFYRYARRSATESAATISVCEGLDFFDRAWCAQSRELLLHIVPMMTALVRTNDKRRA